MTMLRYAPGAPSYFTIVSQDSPKNFIDLLQWQDRNRPGLSVLFISEAERKGRNENPDLIKWHSNSIFENVPCPFLIDSGGGGMLL